MQSKWVFVLLWFEMLLCVVMLWFDVYVLLTVRDVHV